MPSRYYDLDAKYARMRAGKPDAFVDPDGCGAFVRQKEGELRATLASQRAGK